MMNNVLKELKYLFKRFVLIANVMPVVFSFLMAVRYFDENPADYWSDFLLLLIGSSALVAGALTLNNWLEADIDKLMERTRHRPTVTGTLSMRNILLLGIMLSLLGLILLVFVNLEVAIYGFIGWYTYVVVYTIWTKRRYTWNTHIGSLSGAVTPLMGWAVVGSAVHEIPFTLFLIMFLWQMPHTYAIAIRKFDDYKRSGLQMLPVVKGYRVTLARTPIYMFLLLFIPFLLSGFSPLFTILYYMVSFGWLIIGLSGWFIKSIVTWANFLFASSLAYLLIVFTLYLIFIPVM